MPSDDRKKLPYATITLAELDCLVWRVTGDKCKMQGVRGKELKKSGCRA